MAARPLISVVIPAYDGESLLPGSLGSMVAQTYSPLEIVVVDDGSTDGSRRLIEEWAARDSRIHPVFACHGGAERARNLGVAAARGEYIAHLDQDDIAAPARLATQYDWMVRHGLDVCGSRALVFGDARYLRWVPQGQEDIKREHVFRPAMIHSTTMVSAAVDKDHPFREDIRCGGVDRLRCLALTHRVGNVPQVLVKYRRHARMRAVVQHERVRDDFRASRARYFVALFPDAGAADVEAVSRVADGVPFADPIEQERAATWMQRLSGSTDPVLIRLFADRWAAVAAWPTATPH